MDKNDLGRFGNAFAGLCEVFEKPVSTVLTKAYYTALREHAIEDVENAIGNAIVKCKWFPKPVELIEMITGGSDQIEDTALLEAGKALNAIKKIGPYRSVCFDNATTQAVILNTFGGWIKACQDLQVDEEKWFIKDFCKSYGAYSRQNIKHTGTLCGIAEINNSSNSYEEKDGVVLIGNTEKAKQIKSGKEFKKLDCEVVKLVQNVGNG